MNDSVPAYGLWGLVLINSVVFIVFAFSFFRPQTPRDWRSFSAFSAFLVALFTEMYGFPLTIYFLSGWLQSRYPGVDWFSHDAGHLLEMLFGWKANPHLGPFHLLSFALIVAGFLLTSARGKFFIRPKEGASWPSQVPTPMCAILNTWDSSRSWWVFSFSGRRWSRSRCSRSWRSCTRALPEGRNPRWSPGSAANGARTRAARRGS